MARRFVPPAKRIITMMELEEFLSSESCNEYLSFLEGLGASVAGKPNNFVFDTVSPTVTRLAEILQHLNVVVDETPPVACEARYGNKAFRTWLARIEHEGSESLRSLLAPEMAGAEVELLPYFTGSFGNSQRIDYGTGHETSFTAFLFALRKLGLLTAADSAPVVLRVFLPYLELCRRLQTVYLLEPAGSHGAYGVDDYQCLPFFLGAAQLTGQDALKPNCVLDAELVEARKDEYIYIGCIAHIRKVKTGPFHEHSPVLYSITSLSDWSKAAAGLLRLYKGEVLSKYPIMQHFVFGSLIRYPGRLLFTQTGDEADATIEDPTGVMPGPRKSLAQRQAELEAILRNKAH